MKNIPELISATSPTALMAHISSWLAKGWDLYGMMVTSHDEMLGQWIVPVEPMHEYRLVATKDWGEFKRDCKSLLSEGWDFCGPDRGWNDWMLQWMCREKSGSVFQVEGKSAEHVTYQTIERVEPTLRLVPNILAGGLPYVVENERGVVFPSET